MTHPRYTRAADVVWRLGPDRVLVRRVGAGPDGAADLLGGAALVWIALDEPATVDELVERLAELEVTAQDVNAAVALLSADGWSTPNL